MSDPVFRLSGIVHTHGELEDFEGPMSLILQLLSKNKIEIRDIRISELLEQYLSYLHEMEKMDLEVASEFVAMASHLTYIKSRMLLTPEGEEISELEELMQGLEKLQRKDDYTRIKAVTGFFADMYTRGAGYGVKPAEALPARKEYPYQHNVSQLLNLMQEMMTREELQEQISARLAQHYPKRMTYPVEVKAKEIQNKLLEYGTISLAGLFYSCQSRSEMIAVFISVLEMCKSGMLLISGEGEDTTLSRSGNEDAAIPVYGEGEDNHGNS